MSCSIRLMSIINAHEIARLATLGWALAYRNKMRPMFDSPAGRALYAVTLDRTLARSNP